jgi:hypothetical protein
MIYNYQNLRYYKIYKNIINYIKKYIFANNYYIYYLFSILISISSIIIATIYIIKFVGNINEKIK